MRVIYEAPLFRGVGGGPRHFEGLATALSEDVELWTVLPRETAVDLQARGVRSIALWSPGSRLTRQLTYELSRMLLILRMLVRRRRVDVWMARHSLFGIGLVVARLVSDVVVLEVNGPAREEVEANFGSRLFARVVDWLFMAQLRAAHAVVAVSPGLLSYARERVPSATGFVLANGAAAISRLPREAHLSRDDLVFVGALTPWYDLRTVIRAVASLKDQGRQVSFRVVGDGVDLPKLRELVTSLGVDHLVIFTGWVSTAEARSYLQAAKVGVLPLIPKARHIDAIGSPLKLYEYVSAGLPVIGTDVDGIRDSPVRAAVAAYTAGDVSECALAIEAALGRGDIELDDHLWSWAARGQRLLEHLHSLQDRQIKAGK